MSALKKRQDLKSRQLWLPLVVSVKFKPRRMLKSGFVKIPLFPVDAPEIFRTHHNCKEEPSINAGWSEENIRHFCAGLLEQSMEQLGDGNREDVLDVLSWAFTDYTDDRNHTDQVGLSFINCCKAIGWDAERVRGHIFDALPKALRNALIKAGAA